MALIVETGAGIAGANSYVSLVDAQAYVDARGLSVTLTEPLLLRAMDHLNAHPLLGKKTANTNPLPSPRTGVYDDEGVMIDANTVPGGMVAAQIWISYYIAEGNDPGAIGTPNIRSEQVDVISVSYAVNNGSTTAIRMVDLPNVRGALRGLIASRGRIERA